MSSPITPGNRRVILKNPLDPATWNSSETLRNVSIALDAEGNVIAIPVFQINPTLNPNSITGLPTVRSLSLVGNSQPAYETEVGAQIEFLNRSSAPAWDVAEEATNAVCVTSTGAASTQILASGGAGKQYKLYHLALEVSATAAVGEVTVNEVTSGTILAQLSLGAAGSAAVPISYLPNGVLQPNANNALQLTTVANATASVTLVYGAAR